MKKLTASIIAGALMISAMGINALAEETAAPKITVFGTESGPVTANQEVNIDVRLSSFGAVKGMDIILAGDSNVELKGIATEGYTEGVNYNVKDNKIHIVDLNSEKTVNLKVTAVATGNGEITVKTAKLAESGTKLVDSKNINTAKGIIKVATKPAATEATTDLEAKEGYFIPAGGVYTQNGNEYVWYEKDENGIFKGVPAGASYQEFENPTANGLTTFATSESIKGKNPQFGTYALNVAGKTCGTMSIIGDWEKFVDYYRENSGLTVEKLVKAVSDHYDSVKEQIDGTNYTHAILEWSDGTNVNTLRIYKKNQVNWMWKDSETNTTKLQYALRVNGLNKDEICTAVGYIVDSNKNVTFSKTVKTAVKAEG